MNHNIKGLTRTLAVIAGATLLIAACGGGSSSSGRTRNVALCYADQAEKDAAVSEAQAAFDASFGGNPPPSDDSVPDSSVPDSSVPDTSVPAEETPDTLSSDGGGYRRPAVRHFATVPPTESGDSVALTDEQLALQLELQAAEEMQLCESSEGESAATCTATVTVEGVTHDCDPGYVLISDEGVWVLNDVNDAELARGEVDISALSADNPIVIEISYEIAGQESSDTTTPSETQTIECTGTVSGTFDNPGASSDCPNGFGISIRSSDGNSFHWGVYDDGGVEITGGEVDISALSEENPIFVQISYEIAAQESSDTTVPENADCTFTLAQDGMEWACNAPIDIYISGNGGQSNGGTENYYGCTTEGAERSTQSGYETWDSYSFLVSINNETISTIAYEGAATYEADLPDDVVNESCEQEPADYSNLEFSRDFTGYFRQYNFTLSETQNVIITANSFQDDCSSPDNDPELEIFGGSAPWSKYNDNLAYWDDDSLEGEGNCGAAFFDDELEAGSYFIWVENDDYDGDDDGTAVVTVNSSIELTPYVWPETPLPATQYSTSFSSYERSYQFTLTETTDVTFTASSNQSCSPDDLWTDDDGFVTPESYLYTQEAWDNDDDEIIENTVMYGSPTNCAVNIIQQTLEAGDYVFYAYADDDDLGTITIGSSVEIGMSKDFSFKSMTTVNVSAVQSFDIAVPTGGLWFKAEGNSWVSEDCENNCVDPYLILVDENNKTVTYSDDDGETADNWEASLIERFLPEGNYRLIATTYDIFDDGCEDCATDYELRYGFASKTSASTPEVVLAPTTNNEMPTDLPAPVALPVSGLKSDGSSTTSAAIAEDVSSMVCNSTCIDTLFTNAGITDGTIDITVGDNTVTVKKGQKKAVIPVGDKAKEITAVAKSADGTQQVELTDGLKVIPGEVQQALDSKTTTGVINTSSGSSSKLPYVLVLLVALLGIAAVLNERRKRSVTQS